MSLTMGTGPFGRRELLAGVVPVEPPPAAGLEGPVAPDPYHRIDARKSSRHVRIARGGELPAESTRPRVLFETSLPPRWWRAPGPER